MMKKIDVINLSSSDLSRLHSEATAEIHRRTPSASIDFEAVKGQESAKRALTVALAGRHSITLVGSPGCGKSMLRSAARRIDDTLISYEAWPCECGFRGHPARECNCTVRQVDTTVRKIPEAHIMVEVPTVPEREMADRSCGTSTAVIAMQVQIARLEIEALPIRGMDVPAESLLKHARTDMGLTGEQRVGIASVANTIAALESSSSISASHIAEAVNYRTLIR